MTRALVVLALLAAACGQAGDRTTAPDPSTSSPERTVSTPAEPGADWRLAIRDGVLIATPPGLAIGTAAPGGLPGLRESVVWDRNGGDSGLVVRIWHGPSSRALAHLIGGSRTSGKVLLGARHALELTRKDGPRALAVELDSQTVLEVTGAADVVAARWDEVAAIGALAARMRDPDHAYTAGEIAAALGAAISLTDARVPEPAMSRGSTVSYRIDGSDRAFAMVMTFPDRESRLVEDPNEGGGFGATVSWIAPATYRGLGNAAVFIGSSDVAQRYRAIRALDAIASRGAEPTCVEDPRAVFQGLVAALGTSGFTRVQERLASASRLSVADARGVLPNATDLRGSAIASYFAAATRAAPIGSTALRAADVALAGSRLGTPPGTRALSRDGEVDLSVTAEAACERGIVRLSEVGVSVGAASAHPCPEIGRQGVMTKGIPVSTATAEEVLGLVERDAGAIHTLEDIAGVRQDPNPLRDPRVPRCAVALLSYGQPVFARRYPASSGSWLVPVRFGDSTILTLLVSRDDSGLGLVGGSQGGDVPTIHEADARRIASAAADAVRTIELVYAKAGGAGPPDQLAWRAVRQSGSVWYLFPSYPGAGSEGALFRAEQVDTVR